MDFRDNLHFALDSKGFLIKELSAKTGISENTIKSYLRANGAEPTLSKALKIAKALDVSVDYLATGVERDKSSFEKSLLKEPVIRSKQNSKLFEIESLLSKCTQSQLNAILAIGKEFAKQK